MPERKASPTIEALCQVCQQVFTYTPARPSAGGRRRSYCDGCHPKKGRMKKRKASAPAARPAEPARPQDATADVSASEARLTAEMVQAVESMHEQLHHEIEVQVREAEERLRKRLAAAVAAEERLRKRLAAAVAAAAETLLSHEHEP